MPGPLNLNKEFPKCHPTYWKVYQMEKEGFTVYEQHIDNDVFTHPRREWDWNDVRVFFANEYLFKARRNRNLRNEDKEELFQEFTLSFLVEYRDKGFHSTHSLKNCFGRVYEKYIYNKRKNNRLTTGQNFDRLEYNKLDHLSSLHLYIEELTSKSEKVNWEKVGKNFWRKIK